MSKSGLRVISSLRQLIIDGELKPGEHLGEEAIAKRFDLSRTPVRAALQLLAQEGLLQKDGARGYAVRTISHKEIIDAIDVRGVLEGLAARLLAEQGISMADRKKMRECLDMGDQLFQGGKINVGDVTTFHKINMTFHTLIIDGCGNEAIKSAINLNDHIPFASVNSIAVDRNALEAEYIRLQFANMQHHLIFDAIDNRQSARAEALMKEHANAALRYAEVFGKGLPAQSSIKMIRS